MSTVPTAVDHPQPPPRAGRVGLRRYLATSNAVPARFVRFTYRRFQNFSVPAPMVLARPFALLITLVRDTWYFVYRVFVCEPFFKAHCKSYGRNLHTSSFLHWIEGKGDIVVGNDVIIDGKCVIQFAARFSDRPLLRIGNRVGIAHDCGFIVARSITIGDDTMIASDTVIQDANGHSTDPRSRLLHLPPADEEIRPVTIGKGVWIGRRCLIFPGVKIGDGSVVSGGSVVRTHVPPYSVVAGNPARVMFRLQKPSQPPAAP